MKLIKLISTKVKREHNIMSFDYYSIVRGKSFMTMDIKVKIFGLFWVRIHSYKVNF